jgi:predicted phosphoribosyltransferase
MHPARIVVAAPVGARETCDHLRTIADRFVCLEMPLRFRSVGEWYEEFSETSDDEVRQLLAAAAQPQSSGPAQSTSCAGAQCAVPDRRSSTIH